MPLWSAAFAPLNLISQFLPHAPAAPCPNRRKPGRAKAYKPAPLITPFQKYKKQERVSIVSETASQYSTCSSGGSSSSSSSEEEPAPPGGFFESPKDVPIPEGIRLRMEFARMRLRGHWYGGRALQNAFDHPSVRRRLERQRLHDRASLHLPPIGGALAPLPLPPHQSSYIVQRWHGLKREVDALRADQEIYTQIRALNPSPVFQWKQYEQRWAQALVAEDSPLLAFTDIPWPTGLLKPHDGSHITAVDVHRFVLSTTELDSVPDYALQRIDGEIVRWRTDRFATHVLPRVAPWCRESVAAAAGAVLDILLAARRDILIYHGLRRNTA